MITSLALIFLIGLLMASIFQAIKLPRIIGMLAAGIILGPYGLNLLDDSILGISSELRKIALIIILIKAGLSLNLKDLKKVGRPAILMSFLPATCEIAAFIIFAPIIFKVNIIEAALIGAVIAAVSPAVVVPRMVNLIEKKYGIQKGIPQMILAGTSIDDIFVIVLFTSFLGIAQGESFKIIYLLNIPISITLGLILGVIFGYILSKIFKIAYKYSIKNSIKVIIILSTAFLLVSIEDWLKGIVSVSGLLAIISMSLVIAKNSISTSKEVLQLKFGELWVAAEVILFVMVGASVDIGYTIKAGCGALLMIFIALIFRAVGVLICMVGTELNKKERLYCIIAYLPKATVQAAIGSVPLSMGLNCGDLVLAVAILAILITAPIGATLMDFSYNKLLKKEEK